MWIEINSTNDLNHFNIDNNVYNNLLNSTKMDLKNNKDLNIKDLEELYYIPCDLAKKILNEAKKIQDKDNVD